MVQCPPMSAQDRRGYPRLPTELDVEYGIGQELASGKIVDVGLAGFGIIGETTYPAGSQIELRFRAPESGENVRIKAVVCFSNRNRMGVQVISIPVNRAAVVEIIYELVSRNRLR